MRPRLRASPRNRPIPSTWKTRFIRRPCQCYAKPRWQIRLLSHLKSMKYDYVRNVHINFQS